MKGEKDRPYLQLNLEWLHKTGRGRKIDTAESHFPLVDAHTETETGVLSSS